MEIIRDRVGKAWVTESKAGIKVDYNGGSSVDRHYNVFVKKEGNFYIVEGAKARFEVFIDKEYDEAIVATIVDEHTYFQKPSWLNWFKSKKYVKGWCELKEKSHTRYISNNITIIEDL